MTARRLAWVVWGLTVALLVAWPLLAEAANTQESDLLGYLVLPAAVLGYATVGALITARQSGNRIGLILSFIGLSAAVGLFAGAYAKYSIEQAASFPLDRVAAWLGRMSFPGFIVPMALYFLLFPNGQVPSRRWRPVLWILLSAIVMNVVGFAVTPGDLNCCFIEVDRPVENPFGLPLAWKGAVDAVTSIAGNVAFGCAFLAVIALILRFRRSRGDERQQIKWLALVGVAAAAIPLIGIVIGLVRIALGIHVGDSDPVGNAVFIVLTLLLALGIPAASAIAILRYRLYELDIVVKKAVVAALLVGFISLVYVALVAIPAVLLGGTPNLAAILPAIVIALILNPVRRQSRRVADRLVYGKRATPYEVLTTFSERVGETYSTQDVLPRMAQVLAAGSGATSATVWLRVGGELRSAASTAGKDPGPVRLAADALPEFPEGEDAFEVTDQGELLGALSVTMPSSDPMNPPKEKLVRDLAAQAGLVLRNVRLIEELRASRQRLVAAQDEERRRLERNIHDGAQQQLVALSVKLGLADRMVDQDPGKAHELLAQIQTETTGALEDLRDLARGIYPPLLADQGLPVALEAQARKSPFPVAVEADGIGRFPQEVEAAVYFCALEALNNVAKYGNASRATVSLSTGDGRLTFEIEDDGVGFDPTVTGHGTGIQGMADRMEAIGGALEVRSALGEGTTVSGRVPARELVRERAR